MIVASLLTTVERPYRASLIAMSIGWSLGMGMSSMLAFGMTQASEDWSGRGLAMWVGLGSGAVALFGSLPGVATERMRSIQAWPGRITIGFSAGAIIRLLGTVALLGLCSYHMPAAKKEIAAMILVWYVYLTSIDVTVLALLLPRWDGRAATRSSIVKHSNQ